MWRPVVKKAAAFNLASFPSTYRFYASKPRQRSPQFEGNNVSSAYRNEIRKIAVLSKLINQSTPRELEALEDVHEMMSEYTNLAAQGAIVPAVSGSVVRGLLQSARDCSVLLRKMSKRERDRITLNVYHQLGQYADQVANDLIHKRAPRHLQTMGTLLALYEQIDPLAGLEFFRQIDAPEVSGSAMPCMIKAGCSLAEIKEVYEKAPNKSDWLKAHMVRAYLEHGETEAAIELYDNIYTENSKIMAKLDDLMIGEAPIEKAQQVFKKTQHTPRSPVMMRYLAHLWEHDHLLESQFAAFSRYLSLVAGSSEPSLIGPTQLVVQHIFEAHKDSISALEEDIQQLARIYEQKTQAHTMLLNVILTELTKHLPTELDLASKIMVEYGGEKDPVSYRVRLNALESMDFDQKQDLTLKLWRSRMETYSPLTALDWIALGRADNFGDIFTQLWEGAGEPFLQDIINYQRSLSRK